jgi:protocatechuate 3,4-dioxygenase beta subunit
MAVFARRFDEMTRRDEVGFDRRTFLGVGLLSAGGLVLGTARCGHQGGVGAGGDLGRAPLDDANRPPDVELAQELGLKQDQQASPALDSTSADSLAPTCGALTQANIEGPFFLPNSPERKKLVEAGMKGVSLVVAGRVLAQSCKPIAGALLDFWHADAAGAYDNQGTKLRGHQYADSEGRYRLETIVPGHYLNGASYRPAHIHVKAGGSGTAILTTQLYFEGDPYNSIDPFILPSLVMPVKTNSGGKECSFDFVLKVN